MVFLLVSLCAKNREVRNIRRNTPYKYALLSDLLIDYDRRHTNLNCLATTLASKMETASSSICRLFAAVEGHPPTFFLIDYCSSDRTTSSCLYRDIWLSNSMMVINHVSLLCQLQKMVLKMIPIAGFFNPLSRFF